MTTERISAAGSASGTGIAANHFVYQRIQTLAGKPLHLSAHLDLLARAFEHIYGENPIEEAPLVIDEKAVSKELSAKLKAARYPARGSATVLLSLAPDDRSGRYPATARSAEPLPEHAMPSTTVPAPGPILAIEPERPLLEPGYALSSLRPRAVSYEYSIPFGGFPTSFQLSAKTFFDTLALRRYGATRSVHRIGDKLLTCGDAPLFAIRGKTLFTAPFIDGAMDTVERRGVIAASSKARLDLLEEAPRHSELSSLDELFFVDSAGITSLSECDGIKFMSLIAARLVANLPLG